jgi:hypothetical protein
MATFPECHVSHLCKLMIWVINIWYHGLFTDFLALQLRKTSARRPSMKIVRAVSASNGVLCLQMTSVGYIRSSGMDKEEN